MRNFLSVEFAKPSVIGVRFLPPTEANCASGAYEQISKTNFEEQLRRFQAARSAAPFGLELEGYLQFGPLLRSHHRLRAFPKQEAIRSFNQHGAVGRTKAATLCTRRRRRPTIEPSWRSTISLFTFPSANFDFGVLWRCNPGHWERNQRGAQNRERKHFESHVCYWPRSTTVRGPGSHSAEEVTKRKDEWLITTPTLEKDKPSATIGGRFPGASSREMDWTDWTCAECCFWKFVMNRLLDSSFQPCAAVVPFCPMVLPTMCAMIGLRIA